jgi:hypothetical protein
MAHFAELDPANNSVLRVVVISNDAIIDQDGNEREDLGIALCKELYGTETKWVQTSYNANFRRYYAGYGFRYDEDHDVFIRPKPNGSNWTWDPESLDWIQG